MTEFVEITTVGQATRIGLWFPYNEDKVALAKSISGSRWNREEKHWHYPLDWTICKLLRATFPNLQIGPHLTAWARQERMRQESLGGFAVASSAEPVALERVPVEAPTIWAAMQQRGYQTTVPAFARAIGSYFNASQPGLGKTIETLGSLIECGVGQNILVVAPVKALRGTWLPEISRWLAPDVELYAQVVDADEGTIPERELILHQAALLARARDTRDRFRFTLINPEMMRWEFTCPGTEGTDPCNGKKRDCPARTKHEAAPQHPSLFKIKWDAIVLDETHRMMMNANERSASVSGWGYGAQKLKMADNALRIGLSGTPFKGKPRRFWPMLHWLRPDLYGGQGKWTEQYFVMEDNRFAYSGQTPTETIRPDREDIFNADLAKIMIRHTKVELRKINPNWAPPEVLHVDVPMKMSAKQLKAYRAMEKDASTLLEGGTLMADGVLAMLTRLKQFATAYGRKSGERFTFSLPSAKWEWIVDALEERGIGRGYNDGDSKIVIASQWVDLLDLFGAELNRLGIPFMQIDGRTRGIEHIVTTWQRPFREGDARVMLLSTMAGGVSLTLDAADDIVLVDETFVIDDQEQVIGRVHRTSRTDHQVTAYHLIAQQTIDESIFNDNLNADERQKVVLDGRRGVEYARKLLTPEVN